MEFENSYSMLDRVLHRLAFATRRLQVDFAQTEDRKLPEQPLRPPVFVTALPRAGTTLLLECLAGLDEFATHIYRDMPFVLVPQLWSRVSRNFQVREHRTERAHGDGMLVGTDSPEAFSEMLWLAFYPKRYEGEWIKPWSDTAALAEFKPFFANHMRKIVALRRPGSNARYASKNNLNIARIGALSRAFPDANIVVPFRAPLQHAASLLRQHRNFLDLHARDPFARTYMAGVGHFDFGANLKPVNFDGWLERTTHIDPLTLNFWLAYWIATYRHLLTHQGDRIILVSFERLSRDPAAQLRHLAEQLRLEDVAGFVANATKIKPAGEHAIDLSDVDASLVAEAEQLFAQLEAAALA